MKRMQQHLLSWSFSLVCLVFIWLGGSPDGMFRIAPLYAAPLVSADQVPAGEVNQPGTSLGKSDETAAPSLPAESAESILRSAYENRYTWDREFPGYETDVVIRYAGERYEGSAILSPDLGVTVKDISSPELNQLVAAQLQISATSLQPLPFAELHGNHQFELIAEKAGVAEIQEAGEAIDLHYKVKDDKIIQTSRTLDELAVEINTLESIETPEGDLQTHFQIIFQNPKTGVLLEQDDIKDSYSKIGNYYLLTRREIRIGEQKSAANKLLPDAAIEFKNIQLKST
jgi:hypothetical protein